MKNTTNVELLAKRIVLTHQKSVHFNVFRDVFVRKVSFVKAMRKANVYLVFNVLVV